MLASSSVAALLLGSGTSPALACNTGAFPVTIGGAIQCVLVDNQTFTGNLTIGVAGSLSGATTGIQVTNNSSITGAIINQGSISANTYGIAIDNSIIASSASFGGGVTNIGLISTSNAGTGIYIQNVASFSGNISNSGTISSGYGIVVENSTISGAIVDTGRIVAPRGRGIYVKGSSVVAGTGNFGIHVNGPTFGGSIVNEGTVGSAGRGIYVGTGTGVSVSLSSFAGGITNSGTVTGLGSFSAVVVSNMGAFRDNIQNQGLISAVDAAAIKIVNVQTFGGYISNSTGASIVSTNGTGILVGVNSSGAGVSVFGGGIYNSGTISAGKTGIAVVRAQSFQGSVNNYDTISSGEMGINIAGVSYFGGGITNYGVISVTGGAGIGIFVGQASDNSAVGYFNSGVRNNGTIEATKYGILIGGTSTSVSVSNFYGGVSNSGTISAATAGIAVVNNPSFNGNIENHGQISSANGIRVVNSTINGSIVDDGMNLSTSRGIYVDSASRIAANSTAITVGGSGGTLTGGVSNAGTITANSGVGIRVAGVAVFSGGIANTGAIAPNYTGIRIDSADSFSGGISNSGSISSPSGVGINVYGAGIFTGGIVNSGWINVGSYGISVGTSSGGYLVSDFSGGISNSGTITGYGGIVVNGVSTFAGGVVNSGRLVSTSGTGISISNVETFLGGIVNSASGIIAGNGIGVSNDVTTFLGGITNAGTISGSIYVGGVSVFGSPTSGGGIVNSGAISAGGSGIIISSVSNFSGGVANSGTISANYGGIAVVETASFSGGINNSSRIVSSSFAGIYLRNIPSFAGGISNSGTISGSTGISIASGVSFAGGGIVNTGVIAGSFAAIDAHTATGAITITQNAGTISGDILLPTVAGTVNVNGGVILGNIVGQGSSSTLNFGTPGAFTYGYNFTNINQVNVNTGAVILNGTGNSASNVMVAAGAGLQVGDSSNTGAYLSVTNPLDVFGTLAGHGTIAGSALIESGGTLLPGGSIGTLTITGNLQLNAGATYTVEIAPSAASKAAVGGTVTLNGNTVVLIPQIGSYQSTTVSILTSTGTISGAVSSTPTYSGSTRLLNAVITTNSNSIDLSYSGSVATLAPPTGATGNQSSVINAINTAVLNGGTPPPGFQVLAGLSGPALTNAVDQLSAPVGGTFSQTGFSAGSQFVTTTLNPFNAGRSGGFGPAAGYAPETPTAADAVRNAFASAMPSERLERDRTFSVWATGYGGYGTVTANSVGGRDTINRTFGVATGFDRRVSPDTVVGFALGGGSTNWSLSEGGGTGRSDMFQFAVYGTTRLDAAYLSGSAAYSWHDITTSRTVTIAGTDVLAGRFQAHGLTGRLEAGYRVTSVPVGVTPYVAVQAQWMHQPAYIESAASGSGQFALGYASQNTISKRTELGFWLDHAIAMDKGEQLMLYARGAWAHDFNNGGTTTAFFQSLPGSSFFINGSKPNPDGGLVTAGATYSLPTGWSALAKFDGEFSQTTAIYTGTVSVKKAW